VSESRKDLRAADVDREFVAERLKAALNEGRLSLMEYDERLRDAYAAKTYGELDLVLADLPGVVPASQAQLVPQTPTPDPAPWSGRPVPKWLAQVWGAWLIAVSVNVAIWLAVSVTSPDDVYFWPIWVAGPWGAVLVAMTISGLLSGEPHKQDSKEKRKKNRRRDED
jgi:hypothetical protein